MLHVCHRRGLIAVLSLMQVFVALPAGAAPRRSLPEERKLIGHSEGVLCVTFTPDSKHIVSGGYDKTVRIWDVTTGKTVRTLVGHSGAVRGVAVSRDGKWIASGSDDRTIRVWELETGKQVALLEGHTQQARCVKFTPDGTLVSGGGDGVRVWDVANKKLLWQIPERFYVRAMAVSDDGSRVAYTTAFGTTSVWDLQAHKLILQTGGAIDLASAVGISPDGKTLFAEGLAGTAAARTQPFDRLDLATNTRSPMPNNMSDLQGFAISVDGMHAVTARKDIEVWDARTWGTVAVFKTDALAGEPLRGLDISRDGKLVVACGGDLFSDQQSPVKGDKNVVALFRISESDLIVSPFAGSISWEPIPASVKTRDGKLTSFESYSLYTDYDRVGGAIAAGDAADIIYSRRAVLLHKEKGVLTELFAGGDKKISDAIWDGKSVWIADTREGVIVIDPITGKETARLGPQQGLPQDLQTLKLYAISENKVVAAATTRAQVGWCGVLTRDEPGSTTLNVQTIMSPDKLPDKWSGPFRPEWMTEPPYSDKKSRAIIVVCAAQPASQPMLWIDAQTLAARPFNFPVAAPAPVAPAPAGPTTVPGRGVRAPVRRPGQISAAVFWLNKTTYFDLYGSMIRRGLVSSIDVDDADMERIYYGSLPGGNAKLIDQDGKLYLVGRRWLQIEPVMNHIKELGPGLRVEGDFNAESARYYKSALLGGIAALSRRGGGFYRFSADTQQPLAIRATASLPTGEVIPPDGSHEINGNNASFFCGEGAISINGNRVSEATSSLRWRLPLVERDALIEGINRNSQNAKSLGISITVQERQKLTGLAMKSRLPPDAGTFQQLYAAFQAEKPGPGKDQALKAMMKEVRAYGQRRADIQKASLTSMQEAVSPELWTQLQPQP